MNNFSFLSFFILLLIIVPLKKVTAQVDSCNVFLGTNLGGAHDYAVEWPFVDIMKFARKWGTRNVANVSGGQNSWNTHLAETVATDEQGYPIVNIPFDAPGEDTSQIFFTVWANPDGLPLGNYVCLYDGTGVIEFDLYGTTTISSEPGRVEFTISPTNTNVVRMKIMESDANDHIRNVRVLMPGHEFTYMDQPWVDEWLNKVEPFTNLRFMNWGRTNNSPLSEWSERAMLDDYSYTRKGIPYEWWIRICNLLQKDAWVCVPHMADENFIRQMARMFRDNLDPDLKIYVEYSNEVWNWAFDVSHYCNNNGDQNVPWPERAVPYIQNCLDIWTEEFEGQLDRLVRTVGVWSAGQNVSNRIVFNMEPGTFDAFSPAAYFHLTNAGYDSLEVLGASATAQDVLNLAQQSLRTMDRNRLVSHKENIADSLNIPMVIYEGGPSLHSGSSTAAYNGALVEAGLDEGMYDLYMEWMDTVRTVSSAENPILFNHFLLGAVNSGQHGSWGAFTHQWNDQPPFPNAPKYRALMDNIFDCDNDPVGLEPLVLPLLIVYPNPTSDFITVSAEGLVGNLRLFDPVGRLLQNKPFYGKTQLSLQSLSTGIYFLILDTENSVVVEKVIRQ